MSVLFDEILTYFYLTQTLNCHSDGCWFYCYYYMQLFVLKIIISHYQAAVRTLARRLNHFLIIGPDIIKPETTSLN